MEKYVIPPFFNSDFKFPSVNKAILKDVKIIFAELGARSLSDHATEQTAPARRTSRRPTRGQFER